VAGVLDGIKVVELGLFAVGPWASKHLGAMGADVIKVESPDGEPSHMIPPYIHGTAALYISANLNKRHIVLDLKDDADRETALKLIDDADVFIENMRPGAVARLGLGYEVVSARNPRIVFASASAYGSTGPMSTYAGADPFVQAFCGWCSTTGAPGTEGELLRYMAHLDLTTGSVLTEAVLLALVARGRTGLGQRVEVDMLTAGLTIQTTRLAEYFMTGVQPAPAGSAATTTAPNQAFACSDGRYVAVGVETDERWQALCLALGIGDVADDARFVKNESRVANRAELIAILEPVFRAKPATWWTQTLTDHRVPNSRILETDWIRMHPQVTANELLVEVDTPHWGRIVVDGPPWRFGGTPLAPQHAGGLKGEHTTDVLGERVPAHAAVTS
jgi:crotonobetainyl-CoA:carnitine CoA-transferase CaiB-like acyl-CoA transferase